MSDSSAESTDASDDVCRDLCHLRIWQWKADGPLGPRFPPPDCSLQIKTEEERLAAARSCSQELERIKSERQNKAARRLWTRKVTWIHVPVNDMKLCQVQEVLQLVGDKKHVKHLLRADHWREQLHEPFNPRTARNQLSMPFMDPKSWIFDFEANADGTWNFDQVVPEWTPQSKPKQNAVRNIVLFMPYLHWDYLEAHQQRVRTRRETNQVDFKSSFHPRRSLDEAAFRHHDYEELLERNNDQVVTRFLKKEQAMVLRSSNNGETPDALTLMTVDQLWLWVLDEDTLITSFPDTPGHHDSESRNKKKCHFLHLECLARGRFNNHRKKHDAHMLAHCIINRSFSIFLHTHLRNPSLRYFDMFKKSIENEWARAANLFFALRNQSLDGRKSYAAAWSLGRQGPNRQQQRNMNSIQEDMEAIANTQDIEEELRIILHIIQQQMKTLKAPLHPRNMTFVQDLQELKDDLEDMCHHARDVHERLFQTLELKQTLLSIRQNRIILTFTIITIIFLPLGFICSIFGMNAAELTQGAPVKLSRIFTFMFPISFAISAAALFLAFGLFETVWPNDRFNFPFSRKMGKDLDGSSLNSDFQISSKPSITV